MIEKLRTKLETGLAKIVLMIILVPFALVGVDSLVGGFLPSVELGSVNGKSVSPSEFRLAEGSVRSRLESVLGDQVDTLTPADIVTYAFPSIIARRVMIDEAERVGLATSRQSVDTMLLEQHKSDGTGEFNSVEFELAVRNMGLTPTEYRSVLAEDLLRSQLAAGIAQTAFVLDEEVTLAVDLVTEQRDAVVVKFSVDDIAVEISGEEVDAQDIYELHAESFRRPSTLTLQLHALDPQAIPTVDPDEFDLRVAYDDQYGDSTDQPGEYSLIRVDDHDAAMSIQTQIEGGADVGELARAHSTDPTASDGGYLGFVASEDLEGAAQSAIANTEPGAVSEVIEDEGAWVLFFRHPEPQPPTFDEVVSALRYEIVEGDRSTQQTEIEFSIVAALASGDTAPSSAVRVDEISSVVASADSVNGVLISRGIEVPASSSLASDIASGREGWHSQWVTATDGTRYLVHVAAQVRGELKPLAEVQDDVLEIGRRESAIDKAEAWSSQLVETVVGNGIPLNLAAQDIDGAKATAYRGVSRNTLLFPREVAAALFRAVPTGPDRVVSVYDATQETYYVVEMTGRAAREGDGVEEQELAAEEVGADLGNLRRAEDIDSLTYYLSGAADVERPTGFDTTELREEFE